MKIISCGCSFMTLDTQYPGTHFTEVVANDIGAELKSLAAVGASNFYISQQVEHAISLKPDLIIVVFTNYDRIELVNNKNISYDPLLGIKNFTGDSPTVHSNVITAFMNNTYRDSGTNFLKQY